jgi:hypothetical protein
MWKPSLLCVIGVNPTQSIVNKNKKQNNSCTAELAARSLWHQAILASIA